MKNRSRRRNCESVENLLTPRQNYSLPRSRFCETIAMGLENQPGGA